MGTSECVSVPQVLADAGASLTLVIAKATLAKSQLVWQRQAHC